MTTKYPAVITPAEEGGFLVDFPDLDGVFTQGETLEEALYYAAEVLALMLEYWQEKGVPIPPPSQIEGEGVYMVAPLEEHIDLTDSPELDETFWAEAKPWREAFPEVEGNEAGTALRGCRSREGLTLVQLFEATGIPTRHLYEMEQGKRIITREDAEKLAKVLNTAAVMFHPGEQ